MISLLDSLSKSTMVLISALGVIIGLIALIYAIIVQTYASKVKKRYLSLVRGESGIDLESLIQQINVSIEELRSMQTVQGEKLENHEIRIRKKASQPIIKRYNAFGEDGNDLSFSIAILNEEGSGVVLSSIYGREDSIVFAKPIIDKQSGYKLTKEENEVIKSVK